MFFWSRIGRRELDKETVRVGASLQGQEAIGVDGKQEPTLVAAHSRWRAFLPQKGSHSPSRLYMEH